MCKKLSLSDYFGVWTTARRKGEPKLFNSSNIMTIESVKYEVYFCQKMLKENNNVFL